jgi:hypothetical protein
MAQQVPELGIGIGAGWWGEAWDGPKKPGPPDPPDPPDPPAPGWPDLPVAPVNPGWPVYHVPASIVDDGSVDVTAEIRSWIADVPNGSTLRFKAGATYNVDSTGLSIPYREDLELDGNGATFTTPTYSSSNTRTVWRFSAGGRNIIIRNMTLIGANATAGYSGPYVPSIEGQHGISIRTVQGMLIEDVTIRKVYGDCIYVGGGTGPTRNLIVRRVHGEGTGRHGIGLTNNIGVLVEDCYFGAIRWSGIDIEPLGVGTNALNITFRHNRFGIVRHHLLTVGGKRFWPNAGYIAFNHNVQEAAWNTTTAAIRYVGDTYAPGERWHFQVIGNQLRFYSAYLVTTELIRGLVVRDNHVTDLRDLKSPKRVRVKRAHDFLIQQGATGLKLIAEIMDPDVSTNIVVEA